MLGVYKLCKHEVILSDPEHTQLCAPARQINFRQGVDAAPAACHPVKDNDEEYVTTHFFLAYCRDCLAAKLQQKPFEAPKVPLLRPTAPVWSEDQEMLLWSTQRDIATNIQAIRQFQPWLEHLVNKLRGPGKDYDLEDFPAAIFKFLKAKRPDDFFSHIFNTMAEPAEDLGRAFKIFKKRDVSVAVVNETFKLLREEAVKLQGLAKACNVFKDLVMERDGSDAIDNAALDLAEKIFFEISADHETTLLGTEYAYLHKEDDLLAMEYASDSEPEDEDTDTADPGPKMVLSYDLPFRQEDRTFKPKSFSEGNKSKLTLRTVPGVQANETCKNARVVREWK